MPLPTLVLRATPVKSTKPSGENCALPIAKLSGEPDLALVAAGVNAGVAAAGLAAGAAGVTGAAASTCFANSVASEDDSTPRFTSRSSRIWVRSCSAGSEVPASSAAPARAHHCGILYRDLVMGFFGWCPGRACRATVPTPATGRRQIKFLNEF